MMPAPTMPLDWPEGARILGWWDSGSANNPYGEPLVCLVYQTFLNPEEHTVRPARLAPPGSRIPQTFENFAVRDPRGGWRLAGSREMEMVTQ